MAVFNSCKKDFVTETTKPKILSMPFIAQVCWLLVKTIQALKSVTKCQSLPQRVGGYWKIERSGLLELTWTLEWIEGGWESRSPGKTSIVSRTWLYRWRLRDTWEVQLSFTVMGEGQGIQITPRSLSTAAWTLVTITGHLDIGRLEKVYWYLWQVLWSSCELPLIFMRILKRQLDRCLQLRKVENISLL
jgi:hypothetical protein